MPAYTVRDRELEIRTWPHTNDGSIVHRDRKGRHSEAAPKQGQAKKDTLLHDVKQRNKRTHWPAKRATKQPCFAASLRLLLWFQVCGGTCKRCSILGVRMSCLQVREKPSVFSSSARWLIWMPLRGSANAALRILATRRTLSLMHACKRARD